MSNTLLTIGSITREALRVLENQLTFTKGVNRQYDDKFAVEGAKIGDTLNIRKPARYVGRSGATLSVEDQTETSTPLVLNTQFGVDVQFTSKELALSMDDFSDRYLKPALATVANKIDRDGLNLYKNVYNWVSGASNNYLGTTPAALLTVLQAGAKMDFEACPRDGLRSLVLEPLAQASMVDALKGLFQSSDKIRDQYESGNMGLAAGFKWSMDQNVVSHTAGTITTTGVVDGAGQTGSSLVTKTWTAGALKQGDIITIAGVNAVNPQSRQSTGQLRCFVVTADTNDAGGAMTIPISPAITTSGQFQTVTASPGDGAVIRLFATAGTAAAAVTANSGVVSPTNLAYHRDAFVLGCADLPLPGGVDMAARVSDKQLGISIRMVRAYDINNDRFPCRLDVLYAWKAVYPELACRIQG